MSRTVVRAAHWPAPQSRCHPSPSLDPPTAPRLCLPLLVTNSHPAALGGTDQPRSLWSSQAHIQLLHLLITPSWVMFKWSDRDQFRVPELRGPASVYDGSVQICQGFTIISVPCGWPWLSPPVHLGPRYLSCVFQRWQKSMESFEKKQCLPGPPKILPRGHQKHGTSHSAADTSPPKRPKASH